MRKTRNVLVTVPEFASPHENGLQMQMLTGRAIQKLPRDPRMLCTCNSADWKGNQKEDKTVSTPSHKQVV